MLHSQTAHSPILVTGAHRTGTTWVGKMLAAGGEAGYISEPLNVLHRPGVLQLSIQHWYTYICAENEAGYLPGLYQLLRYRYHIGAEIRSLRSRKDLLRMGRDGSIFLRGRLQKQRPLLKDPFAVFSAPWFSDRLGCRVVITLRHPAAFASSLKRLAWSFDFNHLLDQPLLMRDWLEPYRGAMEAIRKTPDDVIGQSSLLWHLIYQVVSQLQEKYPHFQVVRHEDLSLDPLEGFRHLYDALELEFSPRAQRMIQQSSSSDNPKEASKESIYAVRLDSRANLNNWKRRLSPQEIARTRSLTEELAAHYYPEQTWE